MSIEDVGPFGGFEPVNDQIGERRSDDFVADFERIRSGNEVEEGSERRRAGKGKGDDQNGVDGLADD